MVRPVTDDDIGLKVLREAPAEAAQTIDIVAIHGIGAHPDDSWCKNVGTAEGPRWVNWLDEDDMLPAVASNARIMRYGYQSQWFGEGAMRQKASTVAQRLLLALRRKRVEYPFRPLIFIAHCFGGLVVLKALVDARHDDKEWPGIFTSTAGLIFFGTPFRGAEGMSQVEMLEAARREYQEDDMQPEVLEILRPGNEFLQEVVDQFGQTRGQANKAQVACFYELKSSNVGKIVGKEDRTRFVVSESSGCLDVSDSTSKFSLSRTHFDMNKFGKPTEEDFETVRDVIQKMIGRTYELVLARSQSRGSISEPFFVEPIDACRQSRSVTPIDHRRNFRLRGDTLLPTHQTDAQSFAELKASGRWLEAAGIQRAMLQSMLSKGDAKHTDIFDAMYSMVFLYRKAAQWKHAEATISNAKQLSKVDDPVRDIQLRLEDVRIQQIQGHYHLARSRCQAILAISTTQWSSHPELRLEATVISFECCLALCDTKGLDEANEIRTLLDEVMAKHNNNRQNPPQSLIDAMTANFKLNIPQTLDDQEKQESKENFEEMVVKVQERTLGKHHPDTMTSLCLLGQWLLEQYSDVPAQVQHALELLEDVQSGLEAILGATHPDTLSAMLRLGMGHVTKGNSSVALAHFGCCYNTCRTALGPGHPLTIGSAAQLGSILFRTGQKTEAVRFFQDAANGFPQTRCEDVLAAAIFTNVMGEAYIDVGKTSEAMEIYTQFLVKRGRFFKSDASAAFRMYHAMGRICMARQSHGEAVNYFQLAYEGRFTALGQKHEDVLESARRLAIAHRKDHNETQAAKIFTKIRSIREAQLKRCAEQAQQSLQSLTAEHNLGMALRDLQQFARAESCFNKAYAGRKNVLGRDHLLTLNSKHWADVSRFDSDAIASWVGRKFFGCEQAY